MKLAELKEKTVMKLGLFKEKAVIILGKCKNLLNTNRKILPDICSLLVAAIFIFYINAQVLLYADDFLYGTFFRNGFLGFLERNVWHYANFNGRVFVHILVQIMLVFDTLLFPFINLGFLVLICFFSYKFQNKKEKINKFKVNLIPYTAFLLATIMLLNVSILRESYLWISASFNYTLGSVMTVLLLFICKQYAQTKKLKWHMILLAFLAGATTEQMGMTSLFAISILIIYYIKNNKITLKKSLFLIIPCLVGLITIFLSGATLNRLGRENLLTAGNQTGFHIGEFFLTLFSRFSDMTQVMYESNFGAIFIIFGIFTGLLPYFDKTISSKFKIGFIYAAVILVLQFLPFVPGIELIFAILSITFLIYSAILLLKHKKYVFSAVLIFAALFSLLVMIATHSNEPRTSFPFILLIISVCANFMTKIKFKQVLITVNITSLKIKENFKFKQSFALPIYIIVCCIIFMPIVSGYRENRQIMNENIASINFANAHGGDIFYNIDFRDSYKHLMAHDHGFFYEHFLVYYRIGMNTNVVLVSELRTPIYTFDGIRVTAPAHYIDDELFISFSRAIAALGGKYTWVRDHTRIHFNDMVFILNNQTQEISFNQDGIFYSYDLSDRHFFQLHFYWPATDIEKIFGITYEYQDGRYILFPPSIENIEN